MRQADNKLLRSIGRPALVLVMFFFLNACVHQPAQPIAGGPRNFSVVVIDPGHGGKDNGGTSGAADSSSSGRKTLPSIPPYEFEIYLKRAGLRTVMVRQDIILLNSMIALLSLIGRNPERF